jgi:branched-chain amino acid transport system substrate-binding protein
MIKPSRRVLFFTSALLIGCAAIFWLWYAQNKTPITTIKIGALLPSSTGDLVLNREKMIRGMELAREDLITKYHGRLKIDLALENGCFERETIPAVEKFINNGIPIIAASFCLFGHIPILPMTEANKIITFNTAANPDKTLNLRYAFSSNVTVKDEAIKLADFAYNKLGRRRAVTMFLDTPFGHDYDKYFTREFMRQGGTVVGNFPNAPDGKQFTTMINQIKTLQPDVIITAHFGVPLSIFIREVRKAKLSAPIVGNYETEDPTLIQIAGPAAEGVMFSSSEITQKTPASQTFETRYIRQYGVKPSVLVTNSYDDVMLSVEAYLKCHGDRDCMAEKLHKIKYYQGVSGIITIQPNGATEKPMIFKIIRNRTFTPYSG